jgi:hypothetical protein
MREPEDQKPSECICAPWAGTVSNCPVHGEVEGKQRISLSSSEQEKLLEGFRLILAEQDAEIERLRAALNCETYRQYYIPGESKIISENNS